MPVAARVMQINIGMERTSIGGNYQHSWESDEMENANNPTALPMQGKFGLMDKLEASMAIHYLVQDSSGHTGLDRPVLALKYGDPVTGGGGFLAISLPVGFEDIMNAGQLRHHDLRRHVRQEFPPAEPVQQRFLFVQYRRQRQEQNRQYPPLREAGISPALKGVTKRNQYLGINLAMSYDFYFNHMVEGQIRGRRRPSVPGRSRAPITRSIKS